ncbi:MAG: osmotically inducible lipoprotein OsmB [Rhodoferax sp.]|jgi:osmotically inducible lipoprotein OsmB
MQTIRHYVAPVVAIAALVILSGCAGMSQRDRSIATGAAIGGVAGNVLLGGGVLGTAAGAAAGGVIGNEVNKRK